MSYTVESIYFKYKHSLGLEADIVRTEDGQYCAYVTGYPLNFDTLTLGFKYDIKDSSYLCKNFDFVCQSLAVYFNRECYSSQ